MFQSLAFLPLKMKDKMADIPFVLFTNIWSEDGHTTGFLEKKSRIIDGNLRRRNERFIYNIKTTNFDCIS